ncbi:MULTISPECIES: hypothetical protein [unclassified Polaromonas]|uniref:hypothetical protein n=1 Tax=unclassified Polaromonas TaxID=2638319 RepID=UPI000F07F50E|nr:MULTISPECIES: hypothetical protein [unclassified Polaromonas]AYQ27984.1 hypothetical protein DT070_08070 [Polaromonas sp. SP1]QGJ17157.1 hypothetical protein F7R28_01350 [Polaromonas sp. Pch-P]
MFDEKTVFVLIVLAVVFVVMMWRERRSDRWNAGGCCYQCGKALGFDFKTVTRRYKGGSTKTVDFCARCARHRKAWGWLVLGMVILFVALMAYHLSHAG